MSVCPSAWGNSAPTGRIFKKFHLINFETLQRKFNFHQYLTIITGTLHENRYTFMISRLILLRMRNVSEGKIAEKTKNTHFMFNIFFLRKSCRLRENVGKYCRATRANDDNIKWSACALRAGYLRLQTRTKNMQYLLLFHGNNGYANAHHC